MSSRLYETEIKRRPPKTWPQTIHALLYVVVFNFGCIMVNAFQFICLLPLKLLPFPQAHRLYDEGIRYSKGAFGTLLVLMCQLFGPTTLLISFETEGVGALSQEAVERIAVRDKAGRVVGLQLPQKAAVIANHQIYADWWYAWCLTYFMGTHRDVFIVLKKSLKWVPVIGWGMQFYDFIFLSRSWAADRLHLATSLSRLGQRAEKQDTPLTFILYPEGTLVSKDTRPVSKKYADKMGLPDMRNMLLPRSTGLHYSLRSLAPRIPSLQLIDITVAYPGVPRAGYGQSYYTLRSIFMDRVPPPQVHMHIRCFDVGKEVPIGDLSASDPSKLPNGSARDPTVETDIPQSEKDRFDEWLLALWNAKDANMDRFLETGSLAKDLSTRVAVPVAVRQKREALDAFCFFIPALMGWMFSKLK